MATPVTLGPLLTVRVKFAVKAPATAVTVAVPDRTPAFTVIDAAPVVSVLTVLELTETGPLTRYCTG
jgi:hypothetical protein